MAIEADDQRYQDLISPAYREASRSVLAVDLLVAQLQDANKTIADLMDENAKLRADLKFLAHCAAHPPVIEEEPTGFPANALRFSA
jgi:hypothetical protein